MEKERENKRYTKENRILIFVGWKRNYKEKYKKEKMINQN